MEIDRASRLIQESLAIEAEDAQRAGALGFMARLLVQVTMPHSKPESHCFERRNGLLSIAMMAPPKVGLPYGTYPRLLMAWLTTEAVRTKSKELELGDSLSAFMRRLDLAVTGGPKGTVTVLRRQLKRLFSASVTWNYDGKEGFAVGGITPVHKAKLWWDPVRPEQVSLWRSSVTLSQEFFDEIVSRPVPVDMRAMKALARERSPMAFDIYTWLTYRMSYLRKEQLVPWRALQLQFGGDYKLTRQFRAKFLERMKLVKTLYPAAKVSVDPEGLILAPSPSHIPFKLVRGDNPFPPGV